MPNIFIVDDDLAMEVLAENLRYRGHKAERIPSAQMALDRIEDLTAAHLLILDVIMPWPDSCPVGGIRGALTAGMEVLVEVRKRRVDLPMIVYSGTQDSAVKLAVRSTPNCTFVSKWDGSTLREIVDLIDQTIGLVSKPSPPPPFIVHGRDEAAKLSLKNFLQNSLHLPEPVILHERPSIGRTIIEKFEDYASTSQLVFVLLTPDDIVASVGDPDDAKRRARQNVIFEMGFFLGALGRSSGRVILLYRPPLDLPSDIAGVVYIDISQGIEAAGEDIRKELEHVTN
jgi:predicted nucleotide-binding protein